MLRLGILRQVRQTGDGCLSAQKINTKTKRNGKNNDKTDVRESQSSCEGQWPCTRVRFRRAVMSVYAGM